MCTGAVLWGPVCSANLLQCSVEQWGQPIAKDLSRCDKMLLHNSQLVNLLKFMTNFESGSSSVD